jgi:hypothetical protein
MEDIFSGANPKTPERPDELYALTAAMLAYAREKRKDLEAIDHSIKYAMNLPPDFTFMLMNDYMAVDDDFKVNLLRNHTFAIWLNRNKRLL